MSKDSYHYVEIPVLLVYDSGQVDMFQFSDDDERRHWLGLYLEGSYDYDGRDRSWSQLLEFVQEQEALVVSRDSCVIKMRFR